MEAHTDFLAAGITIAIDIIFKARCNLKYTCIYMAFTVTKTRVFLKDGSKVPKDCWRVERVRLFL